MVRRKNYYVKWSAPLTSAARIAIAQNNRETLSLIRKSNGLTSESNWAVRTFYREKAKANSFLQEVHEHKRTYRNFQSKWDENGNVLAKKGLNVEIKEEENLQRLRLASLGKGLKEKSREQVRELEVNPLFNLKYVKTMSLKERNSGNKLNNNKVKQLQKSKSEVSEAWVMNERNSGNKLKKNINAELKEGRGETGEFKEHSVKLKEGTRVDEPEGNSLKESTEPNKKANVPIAKRPFKIRSRTTSVCFSCHHFHRHNLPSADGSNIKTKWSDELRLNDRLKLSKNLSRKLSLPIIRRMSDIIG